MQHLVLGNVASAIYELGTFNVSGEGSGVMAKARLAGGPVIFVAHIALNPFQVLSMSWQKTTSCFVKTGEPFDRLAR
jgi:hypothetical protein